MPTINYTSYQVCLAVDSKRCWLWVSHSPFRDLMMLNREYALTSLVVLTPPLPLGIACYFKDCLEYEDKYKTPLALLRKIINLPLLFSSRQCRKRRSNFLSTVEYFFSYFRKNDTVSNDGVEEVVKYYEDLIRKYFQGLEPGVLPQGLSCKGIEVQYITVSGLANYKNVGLCGGEISDYVNRIMDQEVLNQIKVLFGGRALLPGEIKQLLAANEDKLPDIFLKWGYSPSAKNVVDNDLQSRRVWIPDPLKDILQLLVLKDEAGLEPAVGRDRLGRLICNRCGQSKGIRRARCNICGRSLCYYCEECLSLGISRECLPFYNFNRCSLEEPLSIHNINRAAGTWGPKGQFSICAVEEQFQGSNYLNGEKAFKEIFKENEKQKSDAQIINLQFKLTPAQQGASDRVRKFILKKQSAECLVWAACGAGKTEVTFTALAEVLKSGGKVLYAIPRKDVVQELEPRLRQAFPDFQVLALYGGSSNKFESAQIYVATTHQTLRFFQNFDLVVLDEVDAYPYRESPMLHFAVNRARKSEGKIIYLTSTPDQLLQKRAHRGEVELVYIPARHHGYPLPEPELLVNRELRYSPREDVVVLPSQVVNLIYKVVVEAGVQLLVFVPAVRMAEQVAEAVRGILEGLFYKESSNFAWNYDQLHGEGEARSSVWVEFCHARDSKRDQKRISFSRGEFPILVSTTVMERGITIPWVDVLVLFAEVEKIFDEGALIQMAGRAGRTVEYPQGNVWFMGRRITPAMRTALARIKEMNKIALKLGYLR